MLRGFAIIPTNFAELHGYDPVDLQRQRGDQSQRGRRRRETETLALLPAYPGHDSDDEVVHDGPQHHGSGVGVVAKELRRSLGQEHGGDHPEHHQGVCQTNDDQYLPETETIVFTSLRRYESDRPKKKRKGAKATPTMAVTQMSTSVLRR